MLTKNTIGMKSSKLGNVIALVMMTAAMSSCEKIAPSESGDLEGGKGMTWFFM